MDSRLLQLSDSAFPSGAFAHSETASMSAADASSCAPLLDASQAAQDRLYSRLFQS